MMSITVIALGKLKEAAYCEMSNEYEKRLKTMCRLNIIELTPCALPENPSEKQTENALEEEAGRILSKIPADAYVISLCVEGRQKSSEELAGLFENAALNGKSHVVFIIGSSYGLSEKIKMRSNERISMSKMTFPHRLARIMLLEQIYRAFSISNGLKYHK